MEEVYDFECEFQNIGDTCDYCIKARHKCPVIHDDYYYDTYDEEEIIYDDIY